MKVYKKTKMIQKWFKIFSFSNASLILFITSTLIVTPSSLARPPRTSWSARPTGLESRGACSRRAQRALRSYSYKNIQATGNSGLSGRDSDVVVHILCREGGSQAYIFCAGDGASTACKKLSRYMQD